MFNVSNISEVYGQSAEPSSVIHGPVNVAWNIDPAGAVRTFIQTMELLNQIGVLAKAEQPDLSADKNLIA